MTEIVVGLRIEMDKIDKAFGDSIPITFASLPARISADKKYVYVGLFAGDIDEIYITVPLPMSAIEIFRESMEKFGFWNADCFGIWIVSK